MNATAVVPGRDEVRPTIVSTDAVSTADRRRPAVPPALAILATAANVAWLLPMRDDLGTPHVALCILTAGAFAAAGAVAMRLRPGNPTGMAMLALAFLVNLGEAGFETVQPWRFTIGMTLAGTATVLVAFLALAFPAGRLRGRWVWLLCLALAAVTMAIVVVRALWRPPAALCSTCPPAGNALYVGNPPFDVFAVLDRLGIAVGVLVALVMATLLGRWLRASAPARRVLGPIVLTTVLLTAKVTMDLLVLAPEIWGESYVTWRLRIFYPNQLLTTLIPLTFLLAVARSEFGGSPLARLLADVVDDGAPARVDQALAAALRDPSVRVGYRALGADGFVDREGRPLQLPGPGGAGRATFLGEPDQPFAVIVHDRALEADDRQLQAAAAAAGLTLRRERLQAELRVRLRQLSDSRRRLLGAVEHQRARMESELERGVDDRLLVLAKILDDVRPLIDEAPARDALDTVAAEVNRARSDLHAFVRRVRPAVVAADGLAAALHDLAHSAPLPVALERMPGHELPAAIEDAIWFVCSETIVNVNKHARASRAEVAVVVEGAMVHVHVADDGVGGAREVGASGLRGLRERVGELGGTLSVISPPGGGTTVHAELPLEGDRVGARSGAGEEPTAGSAQHPPHA